MIWILLAWLYFAGIGVTYAVDPPSYTLFWFSLVLLVLWPFWVTIIGICWCWQAAREWKKAKT